MPYSSNLRTERFAILDVLRSIRRRVPAVSSLGGCCGRRALRALVVAVAVLVGVVAAILTAPPAGAVTVGGGSQGYGHAWSGRVAQPAAAGSRSAEALVFRPYDGYLSLRAPRAEVARSVEALVFRPPVEAPVSDPFRAPENEYGSGNRGIEYDTAAGDVVRAAAAGLVSFAGAVAGELYVTVDHGGGVISSYSYLDRISVFKGDAVSAGQVVGITSDRRLHFSVRVDGDYVDPAAWLGVRRVSVRLVSLR